jgi:hypothetical protein
MARRIAVATGGRVVGPPADSERASNNAAVLVLETQNTLEITIGRKTYDQFSHNFELTSSLAKYQHPLPV